MSEPERRDGPNRLAGQTSPYLLQHAHNPVDWWPWCDEAFEEARRRDVPIFLSIGYSTCYWCHVMERESFEDEATARVMNERFVCIKVDREERPDVDDIYMAATVGMTGSGGWPMSVFMEPAQLRPYWCGTYFPPKPAHGRPSFVQVLEAMSNAWTNQREDVLTQSEQIADAVRQDLASKRTPVPVGQDEVSNAVGALIRIADPVDGGFGSAPKFPQPVYLDLLLRTRSTAADEATRGAIDAVVRQALDKMSTGGIRDQVGGGFHRYSVDKHWIVPHFEKMLYDNAQLARTYAVASRVYDDAWYARVARTTCEYVLKEMTSAEGAFYSAQDAEVDHREGLNYLWMPEEFDDVLGDDSDFAKRLYGLDSGPNFQDPHHPDDPKRSVLRLDARPDELAGRFGMSEDELLAKIDAVNARLYDARAERKQPHLDDKVITSWNGLMIAALVECGQALDAPALIDAAERAARFVLDSMRDDDDGLMRVHRARASSTPALFEDYAMLTGGLAALASAGRIDAMSPARMAEQAHELFGDGSWGFYDTRADQSDLFVRTSATRDGAIPSAHAVMLHTLIDLHTLTNDPAWLDRALGCLRSLSPEMSDNPVSTAHSTEALLRLLTIPSAASDSSTIAPPGTSKPTPTDQGGQGAGPRFTPVEIFADTERVRVEGDEPGVFRIAVRVAQPYHIVAAEPGPGGEDLIPLRVFLLSGSGLEVYADYPEGDAYGENGELRVHTDQIEFDVVVQRTGEISGRPLLGVRFQACTDTECLAPTTVELDVAIDIE